MFVMAGLTCEVLGLRPGENRVSDVVKLLVLSISWVGKFNYFKVVGSLQVVKPLTNVVNYQVAKLL